MGKLGDGDWLQKRFTLPSQEKSIFTLPSPEKSTRKYLVWAIHGCTRISLTTDHVSGVPSFWPLGFIHFIHFTFLTFLTLTSPRYMLNPRHLFPPPFLLSSNLSELLVFSLTKIFHLCIHKNFNPKSLAGQTDRSHPNPLQRTIRSLSPSPH
ncbi:hypothetical protein ACMFMG_008208 [Clarireedia jacksonii]